MNGFGRYQFMFNESKNQPKLAYNPIILKQYAFVTYTKQFKHHRHEEESKTKREIRHKSIYF